MKLRHLKTIRVGVSALFFALILFLFLDFRNFGSPAVAKGVLYLQFVPSLIYFLKTAGLGATGFVGVAAITVFFGRVYCSTLCPLGTLQDVIGFAARKNRKRRGFRYTSPHHFLRYSIFATTVGLFAAGSGLLLNLLDPFSSFGRISANLFRPLLLAANNLGAALMAQLGVHALYRVQWAVLVPVSVGVSMATLVLVAWLCTRHGRLYCNTVCPVGTLLGLVSKISVFRIRFDPNACRGCRLCEDVCKAGCIDMANKAIDVSRCVGCYNCLAACQDQGLRFENRWRRQCLEAQPENGRRGFILGLALGLTGMVVDVFGQTRPIQSRPTTIPESITTPVSPPGSASIAHFTSTCTACQLCVSACPSRVLVPSFFQYGLSGMMQPRMDYRSGHCNYDCTICTDICPSGAILPIGLERKKLTQVGFAKFIQKNCVVHTDKTNCGACSEHCPTKAVQMVPYPNPANKRLVIPKVNPDLCVGCGGCEHACPTKPYKAIYVEGNPVHKLATKPLEKKIDERIDYKEDFPF